MEIKAGDPENLIFVDGTGVTPDMVLPYGRSPEGKRAAGTRPVSQGKRISATGALSSEGLEACTTFEGTLNGEVFLYYPSSFLCPVLKEGQAVITDNAGVRKAVGVKEPIESRGVKLLYLPPYSPELPPTEMCRSKIKHFLKKAEAGTEEILNETLPESLNMITENDCKGRFGHCGYIV